MTYITRADLFDLHGAKEVQRLLDIAIRVINRMPEPVGIVCGPITSGGLGSIKANLTLFNKWIKKLEAEKPHGVSIFSQMYFESHMFRIYKGSLVYNPEGVDVIGEFYKPLFESYISAFYFLPGWVTSNGARRERRIAEALGGIIIDLRAEDLDPQAAAV